MSATLCSKLMMRMCDYYYYYYYYVLSDRFDLKNLTEKIEIELIGIGIVLVSKFLKG
mgnify:CR=1 FL=1